MLNGRSAHELLSAYLDDELSPEERLVVDRLLSESEEARCELAELRRLRQLLIALPLETLDGTFPAEVLHQCERGMLLAGAASVNGSSSRSARRRGRFWLASLGGIAVSALAVLVMWNWMGSGTPGTQDQRSPMVADRERVDWQHTQEVAIRHTSSSDSTLPAETGPTRQSDAEITIAPTFPADESADEMVANATTNGLQFGKDLRQAEVGEVVRALDTANGRVTVVQLTVVDRRRGLQDLQLLLERHRIETTAAPTATPRDQTGLVAVYVEAPSTQLVSALEELRNVPTLGEMAVHKPITLAALDGSFANFEDRSQFRWHDPQAPGETEQLGRGVKSTADRDPAHEDGPGFGASSALPQSLPPKLESQSIGNDAPARKRQQVESDNSGGSKTVRRATLPQIAAAKPTSSKEPSAAISPPKPAMIAAPMNVSDADSDFERSLGRQRQLRVPADVLHDKSREPEADLAAGGVRAENALPLPEAATREHREKIAQKKPQPHGERAEANPAPPARPVQLLFVLVTREPVEVRPASPATDPLPPSPPLPGNDGAALRKSRGRISSSV